MDALVREAQAARAARAHGYRERSLALHGWICARCAREFEADTLHLLTVQRAGRARMEVDAFLRGFPVPAGTRLG